METYAYNAEKDLFRIEISYDSGVIPQRQKAEQLFIIHYISIKAVDHLPVYASVANRPTKYTSPFSSHIKLELKREI